MAEDTCTLSIVLSERCMGLPLKELSGSTRHYLAKHLDTDTCGLNTDHIQTNWIGLAEIINIDYQSISQMEQQKSPTVALLEYYQNKTGITVEKLWNALLKLERYDIINEAFSKMLEKEVMRYNLRQKEMSEDLNRREPVQVYKVSSNIPEVDEEQLDLAYDDTQTMVVGDVESGHTTYFDGFVSYCHDDIHFVQEMVQRLENDCGLKLCISARDMLAGVSEHKITAAVIAQRCRKVLLVISPAYLKSREFDFQCKVALSLSPGARRKIIIPIQYKFCRIPLVLYHVMTVDYTKVDYAPWFWKRLRASIKEAPNYRSPKDDMDKLSQLEMDLDPGNYDNGGELFTFQSENAFICERDIDLFTCNWECYTPPMNENPQRNSYETHVCNASVLDSSEQKSESQTKPLPCSFQMIVSSCKEKRQDLSRSQGQSQGGKEQNPQLDKGIYLEDYNKSIHLSCGQEMLLRNEPQECPDFSHLLTESVKSSCSFRADSYGPDDFVIHN